MTGGDQCTASNATEDRILFVDDDPDVQATFTRVAKGHGFKVDVAESGAAALRMAELHAYPLVVTDLQIPDLDGVSLIRQLHCNHPTTVFVIVTGVRDVHVPTDLQLRDQVSSIVTKPFEVKELVETLHRSLRLYHSRVQPEPSSQGPDTILLVEDDDADADLVEAFLLGTPFRGKVRRENRLEKALKALEEERFGVIITDLSLPDARGLDAVLRIQNAAPDTPLLVLSSQRQSDVAVEALQAGAQDFLFKAGVDARTLARSIQCARERKRSAQHLAQLAHFDPLTGLANRMHFSQSLDSTLSRARRADEPFSVLFVDLDGFKPINDAHGHTAGDALLVEVSRRLEATLRDSDTVARLGGDEFAIVLDRLAGREEAVLIAQRILEVIREPHTIRDVDIRVSASIGVAIYPDDGMTSGDLVKAADHAMYAAKRRGRNTFEAATSRPDADANGVEVTAQSDGRCWAEELMIDYVPRVDVRYGEVVAVEAVVRWQKHAVQRTPPQEALRTLRPEDSARLSKWLIGTACTDLRRLREATPSIRCVSLTISEQQLFGTGIVHTLMEALHETGVEASSLEFTLPQGALSRRLGCARSLLADLRERGVQLSVGGVGAGRSSLLDLSSLPLDTFKLDADFAQHQLFDATRHAVLVGLLAMANELGVTVVASGVDTTAQRDALLSDGCYVVQGAVALEQLAVGYRSQSVAARTA